MEKSWDVSRLEQLEKAADDILASLTSDGDQAAILALYGDLGAGKTTFTQILSRKLGVKETVTSPTFVIVKKYPIEHTRWSTLVHIDAYRLESMEELIVLGLREELKKPENIFIIEWAGNIEEFLPHDAVKLFFSLQGDKREILKK